MEELLDRLRVALADLLEEETIDLTRRCLQEGMPAMKIINEGLAKGMEEIGRRYEEAEYFLSDLIYAADIMKRCNDLLKSRLIEEAQRTPLKGKVTMGTVEGDIHDIGKNIVITLLEASGFQVYDLGVNVPAEVFIREVKETGSKVLGMSALLSTSMIKMQDVIDLLKKEGLRGEIYVIIGGAPIDQRFAEEIGADAFARNASEGVRKITDHTQKLEL